MSKKVKISRGLNINLKGSPERIFQQLGQAETFAVKPGDFQGFTPKLLVSVGEKVKAGSPVLYDKYNADIKVCAPVSGEIISINRGERRKLLEVVIKADATIEYESFLKGDAGQLSKEQITETLLNSGMWPFIKQRPYAVVANPKDTPKAIFISGFDSAPLAPDYNFIINEFKDSFQKGLDILKKLTDGSIHLNIADDRRTHDPFSDCENVSINKFSGPHPAGNVGVQIHHISPINKGDIIWTVNPQDVVLIGRLFEEGKFVANKIVALCGPKVKKPLYFKTMLGASIKDMIANNVDLENGNVRYISGNVLTGTTIAQDGYIGYYDSQITIIEEGDKPEFFGWASPGFGKHSAGRAFWSWLSPKKEYNLNTNYHGTEKAFVMTGIYEKVLPMDIYPMFLLKSIIVNDIDQMEQLGIYEVAEEDFALCEYVCPSKIEIQSILRSGLDLIRKEFS